MSNESGNARFVTCRCRHCERPIEFDATDFAKYEARTVECPHCHLETQIYVPPQGNAKKGVQEKPRSVTCRCQHCNGAIEFDANELNGRETATVECPHCQMETVIFERHLPSEVSKPTAKGTATPHKSPTASQPSTRIELFFYKTGDTEKGPYTFEQMRCLWNSGQITGDALYRDEQSSDWAMLSERIGQEVRYSFSPLTKLHNFVLKCICVFSFVAFFLPNAVISLPIYSKIELSMFDFLTRNSDKAAAAEEKPNEPNIGAVVDSIDSKGFQTKKEMIGVIICALSVSGLLLHYVLTLVWGALAFALKKTFSFLNILWLSFALQFPILFSIGAHLWISAVKTSALRDVANAGENDSLGVALGAAFVNNIFWQPGAVMWVLMAFAVFAMVFPPLIRKLKPTLV